MLVDGYIDYIYTDSVREKKSKIENFSIKIVTF